MKAQSGKLMYNIAMENGPSETDVPLENGDIPLLSYVVYQRVHPWRLRWNIKIIHLKRNIIFRTSIFWLQNVNDFRGVSSVF